MPPLLYSSVRSRASPSSPPPSPRYCEYVSITPLVSFFSFTIISTTEYGSCVSSPLPVVLNVLLLSYDRCYPFHWAASICMVVLVDFLFTITCFFSLCLEQKETRTRLMTRKWEPPSWTNMALWTMTMIRGSTDLLLLNGSVYHHYQYPVSCFLLGFNLWLLQLGTFNMTGEILTRIVRWYEGGQLYCPGW